MDWTTMAVKLVASLVAGGLVGWEREISGKAAGLRTNILICMGATLMSMTGLAMTELTVTQRIVSDPQRIGAGIITGIGFLGAGTILQARGSVRGLTTAATIWVLAGIGLAIGAGDLELAGLATLLTMVALHGIGKIERTLTSRHTTVEYSITGRPGRDLIDSVQGCAADVKADLFGMRITKTEEALTVRFSARVTPDGQSRLARTLLDLPAVRTVGSKASASARPPSAGR
ncbi:MAG: MgtC/SapB family protein [Acidobacteriota bacterium]